MCGGGLVSEPRVAVNPVSAGSSSAPEASSSSAFDAIAQARDIDELERIRRAVQAANEATYHWTVASDSLEWDSEAAEVLQVNNPANLATGRGFADLMDTDNECSRFDTIMRSKERDGGTGVAYCIEYQLRPNGRNSHASLWVEDSGRWYAGKDGKPAEAFGVIRPIVDRRERDERLEFLSNCDPLTGMMNRGRIADELANAIARSQKDGSSCGFLIAIINNLAVVNDAYGFDIADEVIVSVGHRLRRVVRQDDHIARYSGAKFAIVLNECTQDELSLAAERFLRVARDSVIETEMGPVWAMLSIGGIFLPKHADSANSAMACAEEALAEAKRQPSDSFVAFEPSAERISVRALNARCAAEIVSGLREDRFALAFQPIISARSGEVAMHEALLRLKCDDQETIPASHLIPIAEKLGLVRLIDRAVASLAARTLSTYPDARIAINVSGVTATDPRCFIQLIEVLAKHPGVAERCIVEITETAALNDLEETVAFVNRLREVGCKVAIDDFGAGYTSFRNLKVLNADIVKIDGSFCNGLVENQDNQYFVRSLIDLADKFGMETVAEWVNSEADANLLKEMGVDYLQGFFFGDAVLIEPWVEPEGQEQATIGNEASTPSEILSQRTDDRGDVADAVENAPAAVRGTVASEHDAEGSGAAPSQDQNSAFLCRPHDVTEAESTDPAQFTIGAATPGELIEQVLKESQEQVVPFVPISDVAEPRPEIPQEVRDEDPTQFVPVIPPEDEAEDAPADDTLGEPEASESAAVPQDAQPVPPDGDGPTEEIDDGGELGSIGLDLSRLKSAVSALDANFSRPVEAVIGEDEDKGGDDQLDMARAIKAAYGTGGN
jgi:diguanylate cyclase (GGDEF)-like protein